MGNEGRSSQGSRAFDHHSDHSTGSISKSNKIFKLLMNSRNLCPQNLNYFNFHVYLSFRHPPSIWKVTSIPAGFPQNLKNKNVFAMFLGRKTCILGYPLTPLDTQGTQSSPRESSSMFIKLKNFANKSSWYDLLIMKIPFIVG